MPTNSDAVRRAYGHRSTLVITRPKSTRAEEAAKARKLRADSTGKPCQAPGCTNLRVKGRHGLYCTTHASRLNLNGHVTLLALKPAAVKPLRLIARALLDLLPTHPAFAEGMAVIRRIALVNKKEGRLRDKAALKMLGFAEKTDSPHICLGSYPLCARSFVAGDAAVRTMLADAIGIAMYLQMYSPPEADREWRAAQLGRLAHIVGPKKEITTMLGKVRFSDTAATYKREGLALLIGLTPLAKLIVEQLSLLPRDFTDFGDARWHPHQTEEAVLIAREQHRPPNKPRRHVRKFAPPPADDKSDTANRVRSAIERLRARSQSTTTSPRE